VCKKRSSQSAVNDIDSILECFDVTVKRRKLGNENGSGAVSLEIAEIAKNSSTVLQQIRSERSQELHLQEEVIKHIENE
jgi:glutamine amidotransferase PdxT